MGVERRLKRVEGFLAEPRFRGFSRRDLFFPAWHAIVALSNMAESVTNLYVSGHIEKVKASDFLCVIAKRATHARVNPYRRDIANVKDLYKWGYYLEHLNICLGALGRVEQDNRFASLNHRVCVHLREKSLKSPNYHADLHARSRMKWPADQAGILYSLWLHDQNFGTQYAEEPIQAWFDYMANYGIHEPTGLYITEVTGAKKFSGVPRGCALSYLAHYLSRFAPDAGSEIWEGYKKEFLIRTVIGKGFREYPKGFRYRWTPDSGPILFGLGAAATGIGLNAASTVSDNDTFSAIERTLKRVLGGFHGIERIIGNTLLTRIGTDLLATSIQLNAETKERWY
ncbi:MAG: hypothetical protein CL402_06215 [Acidiferrobacteraceae bacterium]|nr:hypothetical protein [Acidiferrobacteraceae bacterium]